jgi:hypothetical protein
MVTIKSNTATSYGGLNVFANSNNNFIALNHTGSIGIIETEYATGGAYTPIALVTGGGERMRITSGGFVGIATSNPDLFQTAARNLVVGSGTGNNGMTIFSGTASAGSLHFADAQTTGAASYAGYINYEHNTDTMNFGTGSTGRMLIASNGDVGINGSVSSVKLAVFGAGTTSATYSFVAYNSAGFGVLACRNDWAVSLVSLGTGVVYSNGGILTSTNPSDLRLKTNIESVQYGLNEILQLNAVTYNLKEDKINQGKQYGFIAQEVQKIMPDLVMPLQFEEDLLGLNKEAIYTILVKAIQEQQVQIEELKAKIK